MWKNYALRRPFDGRRTSISGVAKIVRSSVLLSTIFFFCTFIHLDLFKYSSPSSFETKILSSVLWIILGTMSFWNKSLPNLTSSSRRGRARCHARSCAQAHGRFRGQSRQETQRNLVPDGIVINRQMRHPITGLGRLAPSWWCTISSNTIHSNTARLFNSLGL